MYKRRTTTAPRLEGKPVIDKEAMRTDNGVYKISTLFYEEGYTDEAAQFTLRDEDVMLGDKRLYSLKRLYLEMEDAVGYDFGTTYFCSYSHWKRIKSSSAPSLKKAIKEMEEELTMKLRSRAFKQIIDTASTERGMVAAKWISEKGWRNSQVKRDDRMQEKKYKKHVEETYSSDIARIGSLDG